MDEETQFEKQIRDDAEAFFPQIIDVERIIDGLTPASTLDEATALAVMERLDDLDCLRFVAWCLSQAPERLSRFLSKLSIQADKVERITAFVSKYSSYDLFLTRLSRTNQGYENELTRLSSRPSIQTYGNNIIVTLRLYNHDRLVVTSSNGFDGLVELIGMLIETANDTAESVGELAPEILQRSLNPEEVSQLITRAESLKQLGERLKATLAPDA